MLPTDTLKKAVRVLKDGGVLIYPTDTIWGLGCDPWNEDAFKRIFGIKERPSTQPLILLVDSIAMLKKYVIYIHPRVETLLVYNSRPLTIVYPGARGLPDHLLAKDGSIAMRVVQEGACHELIKAFGKPITSTSPNKHGQPSPKSFGEISSEIVGAADMSLVGFEPETDEEPQPSVIASFNEKGELEFIRE